MMAAFNGHEGTVQLLLEAGADASLVDLAGSSATALAERNEHERARKVLLRWCQPDPPLQVSRAARAFPIGTRSTYRVPA